MELYGQNWAAREWKMRVGRMAQIAGITRYELQNGFERGVEMLEVRSGSGLRFGVCPSRGLDITFAEHNGRAIAWQSATGWRHPAYYNEDNLGWLRGFGGGLLTTCGFGSFGPPCEDDEEKYGIHDRASYLPAENVRVTENWDDGELIIEGAVRQTRVFGPNLLLSRRIAVNIGTNQIRVHDELCNEGFVPVPAVVLYHCNFGFPVVSEHSVVEVPSQTAHERDGKSGDWRTLEVPQPDYSERVYFHDVNGEATVRASIRNPQLDFGAYIEFDSAQLPHFTQWKMMGAGDYVCGLEPSNAPLATRATLKERGELPILEAGETRSFDLELGIL
ncbi:MAG TPA: aldose 1-epimerase family protein [Abditibacteriaceae bacterium]|jgi:hypothetical protein